jgi:hypothetical protein
MKFEVSAKMAYQAISPSTLILNIQPFKSPGQIVLDETLACSPDLFRREWYASSGEKRFQVIEIKEPGLVSFDYKCTVETNIRTVKAELLYDVPIGSMPVLYCHI